MNQAQFIKYTSFLKLVTEYIDDVTGVFTKYETIISEDKIKRFFLLCNPSRYTSLVVAHQHGISKYKDRLRVIRELISLAHSNWPDLRTANVPSYMKDNPNVSFANDLTSGLSYTVLAVSSQLYNIYKAYPYYEFGFLFPVGGFYARNGSDPGVNQTSGFCEVESFEKTNVHPIIEKYNNNALFGLPIREIVSPVFASNCYLPKDKKNKPKEDIYNER